MAGKGDIVEQALKLVMGGGGDDAAKVALRQSAQQATDIPAHLRPGFKVEAAPGADEETRSLVDYLSQRDPNLSFDPQSLAERREDLGTTVLGFHGSPRNIERFTNQYSSPEGYWGGHHYFTTSPVDASVNYATPEGADLFRRLEGSIERTLDNFHPSDVTEWYAGKYGSSEGINPVDPKIVKEYADDIARQELGITNEGAVYPVNLRMKNPVKIDSPDQTFWGYDTQYDEAGDIVSEGGPAADLFQATRDALADYNVRDREADELIGKLYERAIDYGGIDAKSYNDILRGSHMDLYDEEGNMVSMGHVMADAFRRMGHDSIDMPTDVFAGGLGRVGMAGTGGDTRHYIIFDPKNVRSRFGAFDPFRAASKRISDAEGGAIEGNDDDIDDAIRIAKGNGGAFTKIVRSLFGPAEKEGLEALTEAGSGYRGVPGKPDVVKIPLVGEVEAKPLRPIEQAAETYMQRLGRPGAHRIDVFNPLDEELAAKVAEEYGKMKHDPTDPAVKRAYDALAQETLDQLEAAKGAGVDFTFVKGEDPYKLSPSLGYADLAERGHMYVFPTEQGFGSDVAFDPANNPLLKRIGPLGDLENATVNDAFRIVHDLYGHYGPGNPFFRAPGEERAFKLHSKMYTPEALPAMASETRGQNSWLNFGPYGRYNRKANAAETIYADQKTGIMPPWTYEKADGGAINDALRIAKDVGGSASVPVMAEDAKGNKYDAQGNIIPPTNPGPDPQRSDVDMTKTYQALSTAEPQGGMEKTYSALAASDMPKNAEPPRPLYSDEAAQKFDAGASRRELTDLDYWNSLPAEQKEALIAQYPELREEMRLAGDVDYYKSAQRAKASQPYGTQSMTHDAPVPRTEMKINMPLFGGEYSMGTAPYNVAEGLQGAAQTAYDFKTMPAYFFPPTAPFALGADVLESRLADDPTGFILNAALTPQGASAAKSALGAIRRNPKTTAAAIGAGAYLSPDEAEAGPARWFSKAMEVARAIPMEKMTGQQALAMLRKGVSPEELKWTGADAFLPQQKQITKQDLVDYLAKNRVQTKDVVFGGGKPTRREDVRPSETARAPFMEDWNILREKRKALDEEYYSLPPEEQASRQSEFWSRQYQLDTARDALKSKMVDATIEEMGGLGLPVRYGPGSQYGEKYMTRGGEGYRETLVQLPQRDDYTQYINKMRGEAYGKIYQSIIDDGGTERLAQSLARKTSQNMEPEEIANFLGKRDEFLKVFEEQRRRDFGFKSQHWEGYPNVLAHIRSQILDVVPPGANRPYKAFNVDEAQSDWAKAGRDKGFVTPEDKANYPMMSKQYDQLAAERRRLETDVRYGDDSVPEIQAATAKLAEVNRQMEDIANKMTAIRSGGIPVAPYVTGTQGWTDLSIKKSIDQALDAGADYFTFTPGDVHVDRYSLSNHLGEIRYNPENRVLEGLDKQGTPVISEYDVPPEKLDAYVGKEMADKIRDQDAARKKDFYSSFSIEKTQDGNFALLKNGKPGWGVYVSKSDAEQELKNVFNDFVGSQPVTFSGLDLKVGGEGMIDYYNNIYKKRVEKVVKDATGKKVQWEVIPVQTADGPREQLGFRLTDDMKEARFSDFNKGGRVADPVVNKALSLTSGY